MDLNKIIREMSSFNNSNLSTFKKCPAKFRFQNITQSQGGRISTDLVSGGAYAKGMETFRLRYYWFHDPIPKAIEQGVEAIATTYGDHEPSNQNKSLDRVIAGFRSYFKRWPPNEDDLEPIVHDDSVPGIELNFLVPIPDLINPYTGAQVLYYGTLDALVTDKTQPGSIFILDDKTTKSFNLTWHDRWLTESQFLGYTWATRELGYKTIGAIIRGTALLKTKINHEQAMAIYPQFLIRRWMESTKLLIKEIWSAAENNTFRYDYSYQCTAFEGCPQLTLCRSDDRVQPILINQIKSKA